MSSIVVISQQCYGPGQPPTPVDHEDAVLVSYQGGLSYHLS